MTHQHQVPADTVRQEGERPDATSTTALTAARPRWLMPGLVVGVVAVALVAAGVLSVSSVLYAGLIGGMLLMHLGGHGGHGSHGTRDGGWAPGPDADNLREPSSDTQGKGAGSSHQLDDRALKHGRRTEQHDDDQHNNHGCH